MGPMSQERHDRVARPTERPPFDVEEYVRESEARLLIAPSGQHATMPPPPEHASLRDSCKELTAAPDDDEAGGGTLDPKRVTPTLDAVAVLLMAQDDLDWLDIDAESRALIALVDDQRIVEEILVRTKTDVARGIAMLEKLALEGVVAFL
jgi:hypothetical protein